MSERPKRPIVSSDQHKFIGRIFDLSIVGMHFQSYAEAMAFDDVKYVLDVNRRVSLLAERVESLNGVGDFLWPKTRGSIGSLPASAYDYCSVVQDAFLMRMISILDCCCLLTCSVLELPLDPRDASVSKIRKLSFDHESCDKLESLWHSQSELRLERNVRFHRGEESQLTQDDLIFKVAARFASLRMPLVGKDASGQVIDVDRSYSSAIGGLRQKFRRNVKALSASLDDIYSSLHHEFEERFRTKCRAPESYMSLTKNRG